MSDFIKILHEKIDRVVRGGDTRFSFPLRENLQLIKQGSRWDIGCPFLGTVASVFEDRLEVYNDTLKQGYYTPLGITWGTPSSNKIEGKEWRIMSPEDSPRVVGEGSFTVTDEIVFWKKPRERHYDRAAAARTRDKLREIIGVMKSYQAIGGLPPVAPSRIQNMPYWGGLLRLENYFMVLAKSTGLDLETVISSTDHIYKETKKHGSQLDLIETIQSVITALEWILNNPEEIYRTWWSGAVIYV